MRKPYLKPMMTVMSLEQTSPLLIGSKVQSTSSNVGLHLGDGSDEAGRVKANDWDIWGDEEE